MKLHNDVILSQWQFPNRKHVGKNLAFLCFASLVFLWVISQQVTLSNGLGSVQSNYTGRGIDLGCASA